MQPLPFDALIFDMDGVIADTIALHYQAWARLCAELGLPFDTAVNEHLRGLSRRASLDLLFTYHPEGYAPDEAEAQQLMARKNGYFLALMQAMSPADVLPGVLPLLEQARSAGLKLAVASSSRNAHAVLRQLGVHTRFDAIADGYSTVNAKPAPDIFLWTAGRLDVHPVRALVFEDGHAGVTAARRGGFTVVGVGPSDVQAAHLVLPTLAGTSLHTLFEALTSPDEVKPTA